MTYRLPSLNTLRQVSVTVYLSRRLPGLPFKLWARIAGREDAAEVWLQALHERLPAERMLGASVRREGLQPLGVKEIDILSP